MDTDFCGDLFNNGEYLHELSTSVFNKRRETCCIDVTDPKANELQQLPTLSHSDREASLRPITPEFNRESGDCYCDFTSPLTLFPIPPIAIYLDPHLNGCPSSVSEEGLCTPKEGVFDPFAPGPDRFMLAPRSRKLTQESRASVVQQLHFESSESFVENSDREADMGTNSDDRILFEFVYGTLLEVILSVQTEGIPAKILSPNLGSNGFKTPTSSPCLSGVAETYPCAPVKSRGKFRNIDKGLCRKLDF